MNKGKRKKPSNRERNTEWRCIVMDEEFIGSVVIEFKKLEKFGKCQNGMNRRHRKKVGK